MSSITACASNLKAGALALTLLCSSTGLFFGCDSTNGEDGPELTFPKKDGFLRFSNRDTLPNTNSLRKVASVKVQAGVFRVTDGDGDVFLIPAHRVIYAGTELK